MRHPFQGEFHRFPALIHRAGAFGRLSGHDLWTAATRKPSLKARGRSLVRMLVPALALAVLLAAGLVLGLGIGINAEAAPAAPGRGCGLV
ncbi:hypothetical protein MET9862_01187 [Methylobacterium symbioticum]|uniref:Uncharacterized protein n=1 Tax=Methylobacterium symbioticum TaxID=2584084 RepID=A0A509E8V1_9HYPH|nr:hypothetical protein MET9862_01187 [Methylobacterium symbioticum]